jgi:hypothetical protein
MIEVAMVFSLAIMGIYFFKSTDLPKELTDRSAQFKAEVGSGLAPRTIKMNFPKVVIDQEKNIRDNKLKELKQLNLETDRLTVEITTLEQEIKVNNLRNAEIQSLIDMKIVDLQLLHDKINSLA